MTARLHGKATAKNGHAKSRHKGRPASEKPNRIVALRKRLQLNQAVFARLLPVSVRTMASLESGSPPSEAVARRLSELHRLTNALSEVIRKETLGKWLQTPNKAFNGLKPIEVIDRGECDQIWSMIYFLRSGVPS
jgi:DNA-binding transcriptional regulator YiaG